MKPTGMICLLLLTFTTWSQVPILPTSSPQFRFEKYDFRNGLSNPVISCIYQDHAGFLWVGTTFGLNRYDGTRFENYFNEPGKLNSLVHDGIYSITEDKDNQLWIGTDQGISQLNPCTHQFTTWYPSLRRCKVYADQDNNIWIGSEYGMAVLNAARTQLKEITIDLNRSDTSTRGLVSGFTEDQHFIWASTANGMFRIDKKTNEAIPLGDRSLRVYSSGLLNISKDSKGRIWSSNWGGEVLWYDPADQQLHYRRMDNTSILDVLVAEENEKEYLYIASFRGLIKTELTEFFKNASFTYVVPDPKDPFSVSHRILSNIYIDKDHTVWIGTQAGLNKLDPSGLYISVFPYAHFNTDYAMQSICTTDTPGEFYVLSGSHVFQLNKDKGILNAVFFGDKYECWDLHRQKDNYWMTINGGLLRLDKQLRVTAHYKLPLGSTAIENRFRWIMENTDGSLWISTSRSGIIRFDPVKNTLQQLLNNPEFPLELKGNYVEQMLTDSRNRIWIATSGGLFLYDQQKKTVAIINLCDTNHNIRGCENIKGLYEHKGKMYICSVTGLYAWDMQSNQLNKVPLAGPGISRVTNHLVVDAWDRLWINTNNGLLIYNPSDHKTLLYGQKNGLPYQDLWSPIYRFGNDIFTSAAASIVRFDAGMIMQDTLVPTPVFSSIVMNDTSFTEYSSATTLQWNGSIAFNFISIQYNNNSPAQYTYLLEGLDGSWHPVTGNNLRFSNLPAGNYTLQVKAINSDGTASLPVIFSFHVKPPFWKTAWFISLVIIAIATAIYALYRYRIRQAVRLERMRMRIATDLHDDIGATLSSISMYSDAVKKQVKTKLPHLEPVLDKMGENSRSMVSSMSDIVWAINPNNDEGEKLLERMENYGKDNCSVNNIRFIFHADKKVHTISLPPEIRKNVYLVFKEAINNSLKYAEATAITVNIQAGGKTLSMTIADNGKGFDEKNIRKGNGLQNMSHRAEEIGAQLTIHSGQEGTSIRLEHRLNWV
jgi:signal transduction histidine kinase/ligand-binding sensor domain-containing protein